MEDLFEEIARKTTQAMGSLTASVLATLIVVAWLIGGLVWGFSDTYQLIINTGTTIITFVMVFIIQHTQNRDSKALHLKMDEIIRSIRAANNQLIDIEDASDEDMRRIEEKLKKVAEKTH